MFFYQPSGKIRWDFEREGGILREKRGVLIRTLPNPNKMDDNIEGNRLCSSQDQLLLSLFNIHFKGLQVFFVRFSRYVSRLLVEFFCVSLQLVECVLGYL